MPPGHPKAVRAKPRMAMWKMAHAVPTSIQPLAAVGETNVNISISGPYTDPEQPGKYLWVIGTTQLSNHVLFIEKANDSSFNFAISARWECYFQEQPVGLFYYSTIGVSESVFFRSVNTPCEAATTLRAMAYATPSKIPAVLKNWRNKEGYRLGPELAPQGKFRRFILVKP
jgi:hypothetical protein